MNETATKTLGADAACADRILNRINGDRVSAESTPVVLADTLEAIARSLLAINETIGRVATMLEASVGLVFDEGRAIHVQGDTSGRF